MNYKKWVKGLFKDEAGDPLVLTDGQAEIFDAIFNNKYSRATVKAVTQYGKSETASVAIVSALVDRREKILIVSPSQKQSDIIMGYVIRHFFDHPYLSMMLDYEGGSLEKLKQERSKKRMTLRNGSEVFTLTANAKTVSQEAKSLMGFGASLILLDESALLPETMFTKVLRMAGGSAKQARRIVQLGNPFPSKHFERSFESKRYKKISIDYHQAIKEGRMTEEFIQEMIEEMQEDSIDFTVFYKTEFPKEGSENAIIPNNWVDLAVENNSIPKDKSETEAGLDVARYGGDSSILALRYGRYIPDLLKKKGVDTMQVVGWVGKIIEDEEPYTTRIDAIGIGAGVYDRLDEQGEDVEEIIAGSSPTDDGKERFANLKAQMWWGMRDWFRPDENGKSRVRIPNDPELIEELKQMRYFYTSDKKIRVESKDELKKRIGRSPDRADALVLAIFPVNDNELQMAFA